MQQPLKGSCQCGQVRYTISKPPKISMACHCKDCQKLSASAYSVTLMFDADAFTCEGDVAVYESFSDSGRRKQGFFCPRCGNRIYHLDPENPQTVRLKPGTLDNAPIDPPRAHVWVSRKQPWVVIPDGVPTFETNATNLAELMRE